MPSKAVKSLIGQIRLASLAALAVIISAGPPPALAFEAKLSNSPSQKLLASARLKEPDYSQRTKGSVVAYPPVITTLGQWSAPRRLAYVSPALPTGRQAPPIAGLPVVLEGEASYYSRAGCLGCGVSRTMANGQPLDDTALTMAIGADKKHLVGYTAKVTNLATGQSINARITDTGGFYHARYGHRVADLTIATKQAIGMKGGAGQVRVEVFD